MLSTAIKGYQNKVLTVAEVIDKLIKLATFWSLTSLLPNSI
ncbi:MAG: DUF3387 domain-containing protein [Proteobacteria bacterium]|nr:DUF3387 domain-containing protein [Acinetobacter venetianus]MCR4531637.1 DUF3387 domain-containing protein [Acinetobacter venetianus]MDA0697381.1 DUF3387 domain-containing protein [Pseudomonadota bacterium]MDA1253948.1 DUF3387 domain-containing protein [Pseudomonadota bacterium]